MITNLLKFRVPWIASLFTVALITMLPPTASAFDFEFQNLYYNIKNDDEVGVTSHGETPGSYTGEITIPETVEFEGKTYKVTSIGANAFSECNSLTAVNIPESVTQIGVEAFNLCGSLASVNIPDGVTYIGGGAFGRCNSLTSIILPSSLKGIEEYTFFACEKLTSVLFPESIEYIGKSAFESCTSLQSVVIPKSVYSISNAFGRCSSLTEFVVDEENDTYASYDDALLNKSGNNLIYVAAGKQGHFDIPETVQRISSFAFYGCNKLKSVNIPGSVTYIDTRAFQECGITSIKIPDSVTSIKDAFTCCGALTSIILPANLTELNGWAFYGCGSLTSITIPESVTSIGSRVGISRTGETFYACDLLNYKIPYKGVISERRDDYFSLDA
ncbi:MAG: leucine-rich repeat domain-containing protein [Muribaculaceae bacterium]|nr:leucine-rich repeat domain-containing protein [Muribaculaceae bacterium]